MPAGELVVRVEGQAHHADAFADLILTTRAEGMRVRLGEVAAIIDGLQERWFALVFLVLALFLRTRVAFWVGVGILTSVLGTLWLMPLLNIPLNMFPLFGFLLAMGILVDDAIIVGESIHVRQAHGHPSVAGAILGVREVARPVVFAVIIVGVAFLPGLFLPGWAGQMMGPVCLVMILTLVFSLIEALLILPAHLAAGRAPGEGRPSYLQRWQAAMNGELAGFVERRYRPWLYCVLEWRYLTLSVFAALLLCTSALVAGGYVRLSFNPDVTKDTLWVELKVPPGTPFAETRGLAGRVEQAFFELRTVLNRRQPKGAPSL